jgi:hypothetical protein
LVWPFVQILVQVHNNVDGAGYFNVAMAFEEEQNAGVVWHDPPVFER